MNGATGPPVGCLSQGSIHMSSACAVLESEMDAIPAAEPALPVSRRPVMVILSFVRRRWIAHTVILLAVLAAVGCSVGSQYAVKQLVDVLSAADKTAVWSAFAVLAGLIAADNLMWRVGGWQAARSFVAVTGDVRRVLFGHLLGHAPAYFADRRPGMLAGRISATGQSIFKIESTFTWNVLPPCIAVTFSIALLASVDVALAGVLAVISALLCLVVMRFAAGGNALHRDYAVKAAVVDGDLVDVINNASLVRAFAALRRERRRFAAGVAEEMTARTASLHYLEKLRIFHALSTALLTAGMLGWAIWLWQRGQASAGDVVLVTTLGFTILHGTRDLAVALVDMVQDLARLAEAIEALLLPHDLPDAEDARPLRLPRGEITLEAVDFAYPDGRAVLADFNLKIEAGSRVGLVGRSGSGKSTVLALLQRLRDVDAGRVRIDGQDVGELTQTSLARAVAVVSQDVLLFHRSVLENIRYGNPAASDAEVLAAADAAGCSGFIADLPQGYDTLVGDRGVKLSGGQRQRLAIARAFLCQAPGLLLDEATSALDSESEHMVQAALTRLMQGRTVITVAHRLSTLRDFDRIVVMDRGRIVQDGSPAELENRPGLYHDLLRRQGLHVLDAAVAA